MIQKVNDLELEKINGGFSTLAVVGISVAITFIAGIIDGIARPKKCHN